MREKGGAEARGALCGECPASYKAGLQDPAGKGWVGETAMASSGQVPEKALGVESQEC